MASTVYFHLPEEILDNVCALADRRTLSKLCLASKTLNRIATTRLYSNIEVGHLGYPQEGDDSDTHITQLTYLFLTSPTHAALVTSVTVREMWGRMDEIEDWCDKLTWPGSGTPETENLLKQTCAKYASTEEEMEEMYSMIRSGTQEDATLALLIASLPNLRKLDISFGKGEEHCDFVWMFEWFFGYRAISGRPNPVPIDVMVMGEDDKYPNNPTHLAIFFRLPNLRAIYGYQLGNEEGPEDSEGSFASLRPRTCPVETIELRSSKLHTENFRRVMNTCIPGNLRTLNYEIGRVWAWCHVEHKAIMHALVPYYDTLENLSLSHEDYYPYQNDNNGDETSPCDFSVFTALKKLKVAPVFVWGHDGFTRKAALNLPATKHMLRHNLPETLEELWITNAHHQMPTEDETAVFERDCLLPALNLVLQHKPEFHPNLVRLRVEFSLQEWKDEWFETLVSICERAKISHIDCTVIVKDIKTGPVMSEKNWGWDEDLYWSNTYRDYEDSKHWINATNEEDLAQTLRNLRRQER